MAHLAWPAPRLETNEELRRYADGGDGDGYNPRDEHYRLGMSGLRTLTDLQKGLQNLDRAAASSHPRP